uniref:Uncharacterized protein n=1 Tax=Anopheles melas TaxID=34690 RepID=A0A182TXP6_9DIPT
MDHDFVDHEYRKNYGTSASSQQPFAPAASQPAGTSEQQPLLPQQRSIIYCVHGQLANSCCELPNELSIRKIDFKRPLDGQCLCSGFSQYARFGWHPIHPPGISPGWGRFYDA